MDYTVTGFSDETISYQINKSKMDFDYMPEATLNQFLDEDSVITADYSLKAES